MAVFPSVEWFNAVRERYNADERLHTGGGGPCEAKAALCIGENVYLLEFDGFECAEVREIGCDDIDQADFCLDMPASDWIDMVKNIQENGAADLHHTLSTIDLELEDGLARTPDDDQYKRDLFYRYNQNFQDFFDASSGVPTTVAETE